MKKLITFFFFLVSLMFFPSLAHADWSVAGNVTQINSNTVQIDNIGSGWSGCSGYWYSQVYGSNDNYTYPLAGGTLGNSLTGTSCQTISSSSIQVTFNWPYNFYFYPQTYKIFYANNNNYNTTYMTDYFTISSATPPQDNNSYSTLYSDSFTDLDGATLIAHNSNWTLHSGPESYIQNNQLVSPAQSEFYLNNFASTVDQCLSFDVQFPLNGGVYFRTRYNPNTQDGFLSYLSTDNNSFGIYDVTGGNASYIDSGYYQLPIAGIHNIKQCSIGSNTVIYLDNLSIASGISSNNQMGTAGFYEPGFSAQPNILDNVIYQSVNLNSAPAIGTFTAPTDPVVANSNVNINAIFTDANISDTHTAVWTWGDNSSSSGAVTESNGSGTASGTHVYTSAGVYTVGLTVTDSQGANVTANYQYVVVYDPSAGFITGSGKYDSLAGWDLLSNSVTGSIKFGIQAKYTNGNNTPTGSTKWNFKNANLDFSSTYYQWLVVSGAKATLKGNGTVNGSGNYIFLLSVIDGSQLGGQDLIRFQIKDLNNNVIYDTQLNSSDTADPVTQTTSGSIKVK